ncbi:HicB family protein [Neglecta sp. X4]|uniref:type II toxin-antitoxin system HicB family antitoxin n=1 Tax=unclassified Neglectibacter TaxID=2632164 RepID=UPI0013683E52|nr:MULTISPECIES: type II toxin-antitoxin system HicB family antitoxin [unclassified Neglectibacter]NBI17535.1 HicB family protein [Neglectibacter sp. 59]NBJ73083.1 HicB family protein [Neglectibacter sp. X4]NCE80969.1 HicB family protein [Neglectibacter sp. X58]
MKAAYPIVMSKGAKHIIVFVPDFNINTQGTDYADAMEMARDAIGIMGIDMEDEKEAIPRPSDVAGISKEHEEDVITLVDVDFSEYRRKNDMRTVRRNVSLPSWLNAEADKAGVNVSAILQAALKQELQITGR